LWQRNARCELRFDTDFVACEPHIAHHVRCELFGDTEWNFQQAKTATACANAFCAN
jgi:hypothetical protein